MATIRVEKVKGYTIMPNYHLRDKTLSLKAKGLLSIMLSLPDDWSYSERGLATLSTDGVSSVTSSVKELQKAKYLKIERDRNSKGLITGSIYYIYEIPYDVDRTTLDTAPEFSEAHPCIDFPDMDNPDMEEPDKVVPDTANPCKAEQDTVVPDTGNTAQPKTNQIITNNNNYSTTNQSIYPVMTYEDGLIEAKTQVCYDSIIKFNALLYEKMDDDVITIEEFDEKIFHETFLNLLMEVIAQAYSTPGNKVQYGTDYVNRDEVISKFLSLDRRSLHDIVQTTAHFNPRVNRRLYIIKVLLNY